MVQDGATPSAYRFAAALTLGLAVFVFLPQGVDALLRNEGVIPPRGAPIAASLFALALAYRIGFGIAGCYLAERLSAWPLMRPAIGLGFIAFLNGVVAVFTDAGPWSQVIGGPRPEPLWYAVALAFVALPCAWVGERLGRMRMQERAA
jgi:hypothetical protein